MNCLETRRHLLIDPERRSGPLLAHLDACPGCAREAQRAWEFETRLRSALGLRVEPRRVGSGRT
jgi:hypothetical protein